MLGLMVIVVSCTHPGRVLLTMLHCTYVLYYELNIVQKSLRCLQNLNHTYHYRCVPHHHY